MIDNDRAVRWSAPAVLRLTPITVAYCGLGRLSGKRRARDPS